MDTPSQGVNKRKNRAIIVAGARTRDVLSIALMLKHFDYDSTVVNSAVNIVEQIAAVRPALVVNYLNIPGIKGAKLFDLLKEDRRTASIPMIFVISPGDTAGEKLCYGIGGAGCVTRPVQVDELYRIVQEIIEPRTRTSIRLDARLDVSINGVPLVCPDGPCRIDLSEHGMYVPSDKPPAPGKKIDVQIRIKDRNISAEGVVLHRNTAGRGRRNVSGMGIMFVKIDQRDQLFIRDFVRKEFSDGLKKELAREDVN